MSLNLEDYFRTVFESKLSINPSQNENDLKSMALRHLEKRAESASMDKALEAQKKEFEMELERVRQKKEEMAKEEKKLKESVLHYDKFIKENDAKRSRAIKKAESERAQTRQKEQEIERLKMKLDGLLAQKEELEARANKSSIYQRLIENAVKRSGQFVNADQFIARFETLRTMREHLLEKQNAIEKETERRRLEHRQYLNEQKSLILHYTNTLYQLQAQLDSIRSEALKWESKMKHIQSTAAKDTLLLGQILYTILNLYRLISKETVDVENAFEQLEKIQDFIQIQKAIEREMKSGMLPYSNSITAYI
ncbi:coiled-coil domain-containing protein 42 homolog [Xyrauchen texanus]|uniref:coiled-coil domain-containing protein 42 homolog n=1 Tax=Xyrauchen texanus TaxID=154827 RepID=UPI0022422C18|nr:coiled-coil domain-containing protein 42 homolog [Xyrauchen texanus]